MPNCTEVMIIAPTNPSTSAKAPRTGITTTLARRRGTTSFLMGSAPSARMASICSVTDMEPTSAAMPAPMRPPTMTAVSVGASSREKLSAMMRPVYSMPPNFCRPKANCTAMTMPTKTEVTEAIPMERTPSDSIW